MEFGWEGGMESAAQCAAEDSQYSSLTNVTVIMTWSYAIFKSKNRYFNNETEKTLVVV